MIDKQISELEINQVQPNPLQPRGIISSESLTELANSVREHGVLEPLVVAHTPAGYQIIAGERRWRAAKAAGLKVVPVIVKETTPKGMLEMAIVENVQREDLNALERAKAFQKLMSEFALTNQDIAQRVGKSTSYVSNTVNLLQLPDALKDGLLSGLISEGHARALLGIKDTKLMIEIYKTVLKESASVRRAEELSRRARLKLEGTIPGLKSHNAHLISEETDRIQEEIQKAIGPKDRVKLIRSQKQTKLNIVLSGSPEKTEGTLQKIYKGIVG